MSWQEERRATLAAKAEQARLDQAAATGDEIALMKAAGEVARADREQAAELERKAKEDAAAQRERRRADRDAKRARRRVDRDAKRARRRADRTRRREAVTGFVKAHVVDGLIYGIAVVSFVMAASAMAGYGADVYASPLGRLLPLITELGMWAFAVAVVYARRADRTRPVWGYQVGVWVFAACAFGTNTVHGLPRGLGAGLIMGIVSVAGVIAHQLAIATPPRSAAQRAADRLAAATAKKRNRAARLAIKNATAVIDASGNARLAYAPGAYEVHRRRLNPVVPDPDVPGPPDALDAAIADLLSSSDPATRPDGHRDAQSDTGAGGGVATADKPTGHGDDTPPADPGSLDRSASGRTSRTSGRAGQSRTAGRPTGDAHMAMLRKRLAEKVAAGELDPATATPYRIAKTLRCGKPAAKRLRAELDNPTQP